MKGKTVAGKGDHPYYAEQQARDLPALLQIIISKKEHKLTALDTEISLLPGTISENLSSSSLLP